MTLDSNLVEKRAWLVMSQSMSLNSPFGECGLVVGSLDCAYMQFSINYQMATGRKPQQLPDETGAEVTQRLQLMVKNIEEANGQHPVVSAYYRIKAAKVLMQWQFKEHKRIFLSTTGYSSNLIAPVCFVSSISE